MIEPTAPPRTPTAEYLSDDPLTAPAQRGESERVERKEQLRNKKPEVCQAICAFANDFPRTAQPGVVVIGQRDDGTRRGLPITDALLITFLASSRAGNITGVDYIIDGGLIKTT